MKKRLLCLSMLLAAATTMQAKEHIKFENSLESLRQYECPEWFRDAKFGIWAHWGPQSVPMQGDWYARALYEPFNNKPHKKDIYEYHIKNYGHPSEAGYKAIIPLWKAENFDPEALMELYKAAGAKYFVSMGTHHDNFDLWDSKFTRWNAVDMGPKRDIVKAWQDAAKKNGLRFGVSEHLSAGYDWWQSNKGADTEGDKKGVKYDGADPRNWDLYYSENTEKTKNWTTNNGMFAQLWFARMSDLLENYKPDLLYTDGALPFGPYGEEMLASFYNNDIKKNHGDLEAVYLAKPSRSEKGWAIFDPETCVEDRERGTLPGISKLPWQTDTSIGDWFYNENWKTGDTGTMYRSPYWVITTLVDVVSKNGNLLLNVIQRPDGTIDEEVKQLLESLAAWMEVNGESIFETRPWTVYGEGPQETVVKSDWAEDFTYTAADLRYTRDKADKTLYVTTMAMPKAGANIEMKEVAKSGREIKSISLLGSKQKLSWSKQGDKVVINAPDFAGCQILPVFEVKWR